MIGPAHIPRAMNFLPEELAILKELLLVELTHIKGEVMAAGDGRTVQQAEALLFRFKITQNILDKIIAQTQ